MVDQWLKVLLVEDNSGDARLLQESLANISAPVTLVHVEMLGEGVQQMQQENFDVVLLDLSLPDSQGLDTLLQAQARGATAPIIVLTGLDDAELAVRAVQDGAQDYLVKGQVTGDLLLRSMRYAVERKRTAIALQTAATENLLQAQAIASASDGILICNPNQPNYPIVYTNPAFSRITGYRAEEVLGRNCRFLQGPDTDPETVAQIRAGIAAQQEVKVTLLNYRKDGQPFWNELKISPVFSAQGELLYFVGIQTDVTERKRAEQKIQEQAALINIATDAILVKDLNTRILFWNHGAERLYGWTAAEALGKLASQLLYANPSPQYLEAQTNLIATGKWQGELRQITKDHRQVIVESRWTLVRNEYGVPKSILIVSTDVTEKKSLEAQFLRTQRMESIGTLAGGIAHDLNNMLAPILMAVQLLETRVPEDDEQSKQWLETLETSARRGADLVRQVLSFARGIEGERTMLQVGHLVKEIEKIAKETFPKSVEIWTDIPTWDLWTVSGDATHLHQVLMNLCVNARDAMPEGGRLSIVVENLVIDENYARMNIHAHVGPYVAVTVTDTGMGIPPDILDRIFEPFFTTKEVGKGTGLGLSTVIGIVKDHGGFVNVYSEVGKGTQFKVYLPAIETTVTHTAEEDRRQLPAGQGEWVLVVDDEAAICEITKASLEAYHYEVMTANDGIEAIALYAQHRDKIRVVLVDMMMPSMDGFTTIRTLHKIDPEVSIIAVSGLTSNQQSALLSGVGVKAFLSKPYTAEKLLRTLRDVLD
ncbi:MAG: response regulator [Leptolyngbyaceae cyanobacterium SL_5_9]|nr:response regulator [Leptolyngbyaceae cyanobacterium SL_5_9]